MLPNELIYHNSNNNQFNLVCNNIVHNNCIFTTKFNTALTNFFHISSKGKANGCFLKNFNTTKLSNALRIYTSNKLFIILLTKIDFKNNENSVRHNSYLRIGQEIKSYTSNGNSCKSVFFKDNNPENVGIYPTNTLYFYIKKQINLSLFYQNNVKFEKLETSINSIKYPKSSLEV